MTLEIQGWHQQWVYSQAGAPQKFLPRWFWKNFIKTFSYSEQHAKITPWEHLK